MLTRWAQWSRATPTTRVGTSIERLPAATRSGPRPSIPWRSCRRSNRERSSPPGTPWVIFYGLLAVILKGVSRGFDFWFFHTVHHLPPAPWVGYPYSMKFILILFRKCAIITTRDVPGRPICRRCRSHHRWYTFCCDIYANFKKCVYQGPREDDSWKKLR